VAEDVAGRSIVDDACFFCFLGWLLGQDSFVLVEEALVECRGFVEGGGGGTGESCFF